MKEFSATEAWQNVNSLNALSRWKSVVTRARDAAVLARSSDRVGITKQDDIFCVGSCFARNIERKLVERGYRVISHPNFAPPGKPFAAIPHIYNIRSIVNEFRWGLTDGGPDPEEAFVADEQGFLYDPHATVDTFRGPADVVRARRAGIRSNMRGARTCRILIITLGLVEVWYDRKTETYINTTLPQFLIDREPERYVLRVLDYQACLDGLEEFWQLLKQHGRPDVEIFLSVSPVPLVATFTKDDVLVANTYSKATQMAAARDFASRHANVHYVPSFESVTNSSRKLAWKGDLRHVTDEVVGRVTGMFLAQQLADGAGEEDKNVIGMPGDWPVELSETEMPMGVPKFASAVPGDSSFPAGFPTVTASSVMTPALDASCLMSASKRIWHAQQPPRYPEWIRFKFKQQLSVRGLFIQNQDAHPERSPSVMILEAQVGGQWQAVLKIPRAQWRYGGEWQGWKLDQAVTADDFRVQIYANSGDPNLVTVQNAYLSP